MVDEDIDLDKEELDRIETDKKRLAEENANDSNAPNTDMQFADQQKSADQQESADTQNENKPDDVGKVKAATAPDPNPYVSEKTDSTNAWQVAGAMLAAALYNLMVALDRFIRKSKGKKDSDPNQKGTEEKPSLEVRDEVRDDEEPSLEAIHEKLKLSDKEMLDPDKKEEKVDVSLDIEDESIPVMKKSTAQAFSQHMAEITKSYTELKEESASMDNTLTSSAAENKEDSVLFKSAEKNKDLELFDKLLDESGPPTLETSDPTTPPTPPNTPRSEDPPTPPTPPPTPRARG